MFERFTHRARAAITYARLEAARDQHDIVATEHILLGMLRVLTSAARKLLRACGVDLEQLRRDLEKGRRPVLSAEAQEQLPFAPSAKKVLERSLEETLRLGDLRVGTEHLLLGLLRGGDGRAAEMLLAQEVKIEDVLAELLADRGRVATNREPRVGRERPERVLDRVAVDLTDERARRGVLSDAPGMDRAEPAATGAASLVEVLSRRVRNQPLLIGAPGLLRASCVAGLVRAVTEGALWRTLPDARVLALDAPALHRAGSGDSLSRAVEEMLSDLPGEQLVIVVIDDLRTWFPEDLRDPLTGFRKLLSEGNVRCVAVGTAEECRWFSERHAALAGAFERIPLSEPSQDQALAILDELKTTYEEHHGVTYSARALESAFELATLYLSERPSPDHAIDVLDMAGAAAANGMPDGVIEITEETVVQAVATLSGLSRKTIEARTPSASSASGSVVSESPGIELHRMECQQRVAVLREAPVEARRGLGAVLLPDRSGSRELFRAVIEPALKASDITPREIGDLYASGTSVASAWETLRTAELIVADLSEADPGVLWALGLCHGRRRAPLLLVRERHELPSWLSGFPRIVCESGTASLDAVCERLTEAVREVVLQRRHTSTLGDPDRGEVDHV